MTERMVPIAGLEPAQHSSAIFYNISNLAVLDGFIMYP